MDPDLDKKSGGYYFDQFEMPVLKKANDTDMSKWLWDKSEELVGLKSKPEAPMKPNTDINDGMTVVELEVNSSEEKKEEIKN